LNCIEFRVDRESVTSGILGEMN